MFLTLKKNFLNSKTLPSAFELVPASFFSSETGETMRLPTAHGPWGAEAGGRSARAWRPVPQGHTGHTGTLSTAISEMEKSWERA